RVRRGRPLSPPAWAWPLPPWPEPASPPPRACPQRACPRRASRPRESWARACRREEWAPPSRHRLRMEKMALAAILFGLERLVALAAALDSLEVQVLRKLARLDAGMALRAVRLDEVRLVDETGPRQHR